MFFYNVPTKPSTFSRSIWSSKSSARAVTYRRERNRPRITGRTVRKIAMELAGILTTPWRRRFCARRKAAEVKDTARGQIASRENGPGHTFEVVLLQGKLRDASLVVDVETEPSRELSVRVPPAVLRPTCPTVGVKHRHQYGTVRKSPRGGHLGGVGTGEGATIHRWVNMKEDNANKANTGTT